LQISPLGTTWVIAHQKMLTATAGTAGMLKALCLCLNDTTRSYRQPQEWRSLPHHRHHHHHHHHRRRHRHPRHQLLLWALPIETMALRPVLQVSVPQHLQRCPPQQLRQKNRQHQQRQQRHCKRADKGVFLLHQAVHCDLPGRGVAPGISIRFFLDQPQNREG
ncbi:unnamed protein product, partial [Pylaiella littoralis]